MEDDAVGGIDDAVYDVEPPDLVEIAQPRSACLLAAGPPCHILGMFRDDQISKRTLVGVLCIQCSRPKRKEHDTQNLHNSPCFLIDRRLLFVSLSSFSFCREPSETRCAVPTSLRATCDMCALRPRFSSQVSRLASIQAGARVVYACTFQFDVTAIVGLVSDPESIAAWFRPPSTTQGLGCCVD